MAEVVLVNPRNEFASFKTFEVLSLGYLASYAERSNLPVSIYDCNFEDPRPEAVAAFCKERDALAVGFTTMVGGLRNTFQIAEEVSRISPDIPIICGGYSATFEATLILRDCPAVDFVLRGEGELSFLKWLHIVHGAKSVETGFDSVPGLMFRVRGGTRLVQGPILVDALDDLPFPRRSQYLDRIGLASLLSSRGCSAACSFCSIQEFHRISSNGAIRCRSPRNVADEIELIHKQWGISRFLFIDDNFFMSERFAPGRLAGIAREILARGMSEIRFEVSSRASDLRLPELEALVEAGLDCVYMGIESGSADQLRRYRKGSPRRNVWAIKALRARGIRLDIGYIPFDPYLEPDELLDNLNFLLEQDLIEPGTLNTLTVSTNLFPGTSLHERAKADGLLHQTEDYYYWFTFKNHRMAPVYEEILDYFKKSYVIGVVSAYSNGVRQRGYCGLSTRALSAWLRQLLQLWIRRVEALLAGRNTSGVDRDIEDMEAFVSNALNAQMLVSRATGAGGLSPARRRGLDAIREVANELARLVEGNALSPKWTRPFAVEELYRRARSELTREHGKKEIAWLRPNEAFAVLCPLGERLELIDVFVPPDIDRAPTASQRVAGTPPATLYLGSASGMPPIECQLVGPSGELLHVEALFKGWTELLPPKSGLIARLKLLSHVHLFGPVEVRTFTPSPLSLERSPFQWRDQGNEGNSTGTASRKRS